MPKLDYKPPMSTGNKFQPTVPKAPRLSVSTKSSREAAKENIIARMKEKAETKKRMNQQNTPREKFVPTVPTPFRLRSDERGEIYRQSMNEKAREEAELAKARRFKARSFVNKPPSAVTRPKHRETTSPRPFNLECVSRHEAYEASFKAKLHEEETLKQRQSRVHRANPIPPSNKNPFTPEKPSEKGRSNLSFQSPDLNVEERLKRRHEFDESVRQKQQRELEAALQLDEQAYVAEMEELKKLRRLPVSEGGMAFTASPISSNLRLRSNPSPRAQAH